MNAGKPAAAQNIQRVRDQGPPVELDQALVRPHPAGSPAGEDESRSLRIRPGVRPPQRPASSRNRIMRSDAQFEVLQMELLIRRMQVVIRQPKAHHHAGQTEVAVEVADDGNRSARADEHRVLAPDFVQRARGRLNVLLSTGIRQGSPE